jgi:hypothetical protein
MRRSRVIDAAIAAADPPLTEGQAALAHSILKSRGMNCAVVHVDEQGRAYSATGCGSRPTSRWRRALERRATPADITVRVVQVEPTPLMREWLDNPEPGTPIRGVRIYPMQESDAVRERRKTGSYDPDDPTIYTMGVTIYTRWFAIPIRWRRRHRPTLYFNPTTGDSWVKDGR